MKTARRVVIIGCNFAGLAAATALKDRLGARCDVTVISRADRFVFHPALAQLALGALGPSAVVFPVSGLLAERGVAFREDVVVRLDLARHRVITRSTEERYDYLVLATGAKPNYGAVPGLGPRGYTQSIMAVAEAEQAHHAFERLLAEPGPVVIGDVQGSACRVPAYEFLLHLERALERRQLAGRAPVTHLTSGPALGAGPFEVVAHAAVAEILPGQVRLVDGRTLPFAFGMLLPPFLGVDAVRSCEELTDAAGFVKVNAFGQNDAHPEVFSAGAAVAGEPPEKPGDLAERMALRAASNIAAALVGEPLSAQLPPSPAGPTAGADAGEGAWAVHRPESAWVPAAFRRLFPRAQ